MSYLPQRMLLWVRQVQAKAQRAISRPARRRGDPDEPSCGVCRAGPVGSLGRLRRPFLQSSWARSGGNWSASRCIVHATSPERYNATYSMLQDMGLDVLREFWPEIARKFKTGCTKIAEQPPKPATEDHLKTGGNVRF